MDGSAGRNPAPALSFCDARCRETCKNLQNDELTKRGRKTALFSFLIKRSGWSAS